MIFFMGDPWCKIKNEIGLGQIFFNFHCRNDAKIIGVLLD